MEQYNVLASVRNVHRNLALAKLATLGIVISEWNPDQIIEEHGDILGASTGIVSYGSAPLLLPSPIYSESQLALKDSYASFDLTRNRFNEELKQNPRYDKSVKRLVHEVEESVFILNLWQIGAYQSHKQEFASIFLMPDTPPFAVHDGDLQYVWNGHENATDIDLLPELDAAFEGAGRFELDKNQCKALIAAISNSTPRFYTNEDYYLL